MSGNRQKIRLDDINRRDKLWDIICRIDTLITNVGLTKKMITYVNEAVFGNHVYTVGTGGDFEDINDIDTWWNNTAPYGDEEELYVFYILPELHKLYSGLEFNDVAPSIALIGLSEQNTVIENYSGTNISMLKKFGGNILLRGLRIKGDETQSDIGFEEDGGLTGGSSNFYIDHCIFDCVSIGIITDNVMTSPLHVTNCKFIWNDAYGIDWRNNAGDTSKIADCVFLGPTPVGSSIAIRTEGNTVSKIEDIYITSYDKGLYTRNGGVANNIKCFSCTEAFYVEDQYDYNNPLLLSNCMADGCTTDIETIDNTSKVYISGGMFDASKITQFAGSVISGYFIDPTTDEVVMYPENITPFTAKVSSDDTTPGYLDGKLIAGSNITLTPGNPGGDETLEISVSAAGINDHKVKVSANDTTENYLLEKVTSEAPIVISESNDGGDEDVSITLSVDGTTIGVNGSDELYVPNNGIDTAQLADGAVSGAKLNDFSGAGNGRIVVKDTGGSLNYKALTDLYDAVFIVDPEGYGDYTDIATALSAASSASPTSSSRKLVLIAPGTYTITSGLTAVQYVDIVGMSRDVCRIVDGAGSAITMLTLASNITVANLSFIGQYGTYDSIGLAYGGTRADVNMENLYIYNCKRGIYSNNRTITDSLIHNCKIENSNLSMQFNDGSTTNVRATDIEILESTAGKGGYGIYSNDVTLHIQNVYLKGGITFGIMVNNNGGLLKAQNCIVDSADTAYVSWTGSAQLWLGDCSAENCTTDVRTAATASRAYLSGGMFDETTFNDAGRGVIGSKGITGGFFDLNGEDWSTRAP